MSTAIRDLFKKDIFRPIKGVIKADDNTGQSLKNEIEEYVVTREIGRKLDKFLEAYNDYEAASGNGVWISGFFGSGKSHLLKMLALVLENKEIDGTSPLELFLERCRLTEDGLRASDLQKAAQIPSESILFNIDQKASAINKSGTEAVLGVFLRVFNEHCGYFGKQPYIANFERDLDSDGELESFKQIYAEITGKTWEKDREKLLFMGRYVAQALARLKGGSEDDYKDILKKYSSYNLSINDFCELVRDYVTKRGKDFRLNFFVDEVGQYVADNVQLMTQLQTLSETLTTVCGAQAWLIVTAQEDMETVMGSESGQQSNDFSKIQDRFKVRLKLSSQDVSEVIQKRLLDKKSEVKADLQVLYDRERNNFKTLFDFVDNSRTYSRFKDDDNFIDCYPFIPYQFELFQDCIRALSEKNAFEGRHSSVGERSMLGVFQEVVQILANGDTALGGMASFDLMFEGIRNQLKSRNQQAVINAEGRLSDDKFTVKVLKALLLVKYVQGFKATLPNITILMQSSFGEDRAALRRQVDESLDRLVRETYIEKHADEYSFLTDDEKEVEDSINSTSIDDSELNDALAELFFKRILKGSKIHDSQSGGDHAYTTLLDCNPRGKAYALAINLISPLAEARPAESWMSARAVDRELVVVLPEDDKLLRELRKFIKTRKYAQHHTGDTTPLQLAIINEKVAQNHHREEELLTMLSELTSRARLFALGDELPISGGSDPRVRVEKGFLVLVSKAYYYRDKVAGQIFKEEHIDSILSSTPLTPISEAESAIKSRLEELQRNGQQATVTSLRTDFEGIPYGWPYPALPCLLAQLHARKLISFADSSSHKLEGKPLIEGLTKTPRQQSTFVNLRTQISESRIIELKKFIHEYFHLPCDRSDASEVAQFALVHFKERATLFEHYKQDVENKGWPLSNKLDNAIQRLSATIHCHEELELYGRLDGVSREQLLNEWDDYLEPLSTFMNDRSCHQTFERVWELTARRRNPYEEIADRRADLPLYREAAQSFDKLKAFCLNECFYFKVHCRELAALKEQFERQIKDALATYKQAVKTKLQGIEADIRDDANFKSLTGTQQSQITSQLQNAATRLEEASEYGSVLRLENDYEQNLKQEIFTKIVALKGNAENNVTSVTNPEPTSPSQLPGNSSVGQGTVSTATASTSGTATASTVVQPVREPSERIVKKLGQVKTNYPGNIISTASELDDYLGQLKEALQQEIAAGHTILVK